MPQPPELRLVTEARLPLLVGAGSGDGGVTDVELSAALQTKADQSAIDAATSLPAPNSLVRRDGNGRLQVVTPTGGNDAATKAYADGLGVVTATPSTVVRRDVGGRFETFDPVTGPQVATKAYADTKLTADAAAAIVDARLNVLLGPAVEAALAAQPAPPPPAPDPIEVSG